MHDRLRRTIEAGRQRAPLRQAQQRLQQLRRFWRRGQPPPHLALLLADGRLAACRSDIQQHLAGIQQGIIRRCGSRAAGRRGAAGSALQRMSQQLVQHRRLGQRVQPLCLLLVRRLAAARGVAGV